MAEYRVLRSREIVNKRVATRSAMVNEQVRRGPRAAVGWTSAARPRRDGEWTSAARPRPDANLRPFDAQSRFFRDQIRVRYLTDSDCEQPNCRWRSRRQSQLILTCGFTAKKWGSTRAKPDWLLTVAIPPFMRLKSGAKREPGRRNAYRARGSNAIRGLRGYFLLRLTVTPAAMQTTAATANTMGSVALLVSPVWGSCFAGCSGSLGLAAGAV